MHHLEARQGQVIKSSSFQVARICKPVLRRCLPHLKPHDHLKNTRFQTQLISALGGDTTKAIELVSDGLRPELSMKSAKSAINTMTILRIFKRKTFSVPIIYTLSFCIRLRRQEVSEIAMIISGAVDQKFMLNLRRKDAQYTVGMRNSTGSQVLRTSLSRVIRFRPLVKGNEDAGYEGETAR